MTTGESNGAKEGGKLIPCAHCTSDIYCEMNGCKWPRSAGGKVEAPSSTTGAAPSAPAGFGSAMAKLRRLVANHLYPELKPVVDFIDGVKGLAPLNEACPIHGHGRVTPPAMVTPTAGCTCGVMEGGKC